MLGHLLFGNQGTGVAPEAGPKGGAHSGKAAVPEAVAGRGSEGFLPFADVVQRLVARGEAAIAAPAPPAGPDLPATTAEAAPPDGAPPAGDDAESVPGPSAESEEPQLAGWPVEVAADGDADPEADALLDAAIPLGGSSDTPRRVDALTGPSAAPHGNPGEPLMLAPGAASLRVARNDFEPRVGMALRDWAAREGAPRGLDPGPSLPGGASGRLPQDAALTRPGQASIHKVGYIDNKRLHFR